MRSRETRIGQLFVELADTLTGDFDAVELMQQLAEACVELLEVDAAGLMLLDPRGHPRLVASAPALMYGLELFELQADEGPCMDVIRTGDPVLNIQVSEAQDRWPHFTAVALEAGMRSTHALPLKLRASLIGAVNLFARREQHLTHSDVALGQALADVAAIVLVQQRATGDPAIRAEQMRAALHTRVLIEQAKGVLAEHSGLHPADTFPFLRTHARQMGRTLHDVAERVVTGKLSSTDLLSETDSSPPNQAG